MPRNVYTPSELNHEVRLHIEAGFPRLWVEGEISNLARPASGHLYFTLKDDRAQLRCALFRSNAMALGFRPENGQQVQVRGRLSLYEGRGEFQMVADTMEAAGEGRLRAAFEALRLKLEAEGLFDPERRQPMPPYPARIGVITSPSGAVIRDIVHVLQRRWPLARVRLYPVPVQGEEAPGALVRALQAANRHAWAQALIIGRGGGSLEDLWAFNEEQVARAVHASAIPVVSAVGHESDYSICDFVADLRAPTPSAAAELLTPDQATLARAFTAALARLQGSAEASLNRRAQRLDDLTGRLARQHPARRMQQYQAQLQLLRRRQAVAALRLVSERRQRLQPLSQRLQTEARALLRPRRQALAALARTLHAISPLATLERGYAIVRLAANDRLVLDPRQVRPGDLLLTELAGGVIESSVQRIRSEAMQPPDEEAADPA